MIKNIIFIFLFCYVAGFTQTKCIAPDSSGNNLVHVAGYKTSKYGDIPTYTKAGKGGHTLILIPGLGFDASVFEDFIKANKSNYTMYTITLPGFGNTQAPAMPTVDTSYGKQYWNKGAIEGILKLIEKEKIQKPILVGHFTQGTQLALRTAIDNPTKIKAVVILGGPAKFILIDKGVPKEYPLKSTIAYTDKYTAPTWFKLISKRTWDNGNYLPEVYSKDSLIGSKMWKQSASVPLPVMVRYLCEFIASDVTLELDKIKCPVLILRAMFNDKVLQNPINNYVQPQFIDSWNSSPSKNALIEIKDIHDVGSFMWKDKSIEVYKEINLFLKTFPK